MRGSQSEDDTRHMSVINLRPRRAYEDQSWAKEAACLGQYSRVDGQDPFFDYGRNTAKINAAKRICHGCPVRLQCLRENIDVPRGIFGGYTESERWELLGRGRRRPTHVEAQAYFAQARPPHRRPA